jgi:hypothetical protein
LNSMIPWTWVVQRVQWPTVRFNSLRGKEPFSPPTYSNRLSGPPNLPARGTTGFLLRVKC